MEMEQTKIMKGTKKVNIELTLYYAKKYISIIIGGEKNGNSQL